jgi:transketolase
VLVDAEGDLDIVLIGAGSEVELALMAREELKEHGFGARVVSLPSWELFDRQDGAYRECVLGPPGTPRLSIEAGTTIGWCRYTGWRGRSVGIDTYGASGPGAKVLAHYGFTKEHVTAEALRLLDRPDFAAILEPEPEESGETAGEEAKGAEGHS